MKVKKVTNNFNNYNAGFQLYHEWKNINGKGIRKYKAASKRFDVNLRDVKYESNYE